eukprot:5145095-Pyramimonas_sp.AAC.1
MILLTIQLVQDVVVSVVDHLRHQVLDLVLPPYSAGPVRVGQGLLVVETEVPVYAAVAILAARALAAVQASRSEDRRDHADHEELLATRADLHEYDPQTH